MHRNTAGTLKVFAFNRATNAPVLGDAANITCRVSLDGGARIALTDTSPTELEDGYYLFDVTAAETNATTVDFFPESSSSGVQVIPAEHRRYTSRELEIAAKTALISGGSVQVNLPVTATGSLRPIVIGDDYLAANGRAFTWTISAIAGITPGTATAYFGGTSTGSPQHTFLVTGTVTDNGNGTWTVRCDMPRATSATLLEQQYEWTLGIQASGGTRVTPVRWGERVQAVESHTWS